MYICIFTQECGFTYSREGGFVYSRDGGFINSSDGRTYIPGSPDLYVLRRDGGTYVFLGRRGLYIPGMAGFTYSRQGRICICSPTVLAFEGFLLLL